MNFYAEIKCNSDETRVKFEILYSAITLKVYLFRPYWFYYFLRKQIHVFDFISATFMGYIATF